MVFKIKHKYFYPVLFVFLSLYSPVITSFIKCLLPNYVSIWDAFNIFLIFPFCILVLHKGGRFRIPPIPFLIGVTAIIAARILSLANPMFFQLELIYSVLRYVETLFVILIWLNILRGKDIGLIPTLVLLVVFVDTTTAIVQVIFSGGVARALGLTAGLTTMQTFSILYLFIKTIASTDKRYLRYLGIIYLVFGLILSLTRSAWITFIISLGILFLSSRKAIKLIIIKIGIAFTFIGAGLYVIWPQMQIRVEQMLSGGGTIGIRLALWDMALSGFLSFPLTGIGSGAFARNYSFLLNLSGQSLPQQYWELSTHNEMLEALVETGIVGIAAYLFYFIIMLNLILSPMRKFRVSLPTKLDGPFAVQLAAACTLFGVVVSDLYAQGSFSVPFMILCIMLFGKEKTETVN
jgi:O-antigen ligase